MDKIIQNLIASNVLPIKDNNVYLIMILLKEFVVIHQFLQINRLKFVKIKHKIYTVLIQRVLKPYNIVF